MLLLITLRSRRRQAMKQRKPSAHSLGSLQVTHSQGMSQRMQQLAFTQGTDSLTVTAPPNPNAGTRQPQHDASLCHCSAHPYHCMRMLQLAPLRLCFNWQHPPTLYPSPDCCTTLCYMLLQLPPASTTSSWCPVTHTASASGFRRVTSAGALQCSTHWVPLSLTIL